MAVWDQLEDSVDEAEFEWVRAADSWLRTLERGAWRGGLEDFVRRRGADLSVLQGPSTPPLGLHTVGFLRASDSDEWVPAILVVNEFSRSSSLSSPERAADLPELQAILGEAGSVPDRLLVVGIEPPTDSYASVHGDLFGTLGVRVRMPDGRAGVTTAGHVAKTVGDKVTVNGQYEMTVVFSDHRHAHPFPEVCADIAVLAWDGEWPSAVPGPAIGGVVRVGDLASVRAVRRPGAAPASGLVRYLGERFPVAETEGCWGDFVMVDPPISVGGDSGAMAVDQELGLFGQVVGGKDGAYSIVQPIEYLLAAAGCEIDVH